jgi:hypothetical protein
MSMSKKYRIYVYWGRKAWEDSEHLAVWIRGFPFDTHREAERAIETHIHNLCHEWEDDSAQILERFQDTPNVTRIHVQFNHANNSHSISTYYIVYGKGRRYEI